MIKHLKNVRAGIEMGLRYVKWLGKNVKVYVRKEGGLTFISDAYLSYGDVVDVTIDKESNIVALRFVGERAQTQADSWLVLVEDGYDCDTIETVVAENENQQKLLVVPTDTTFIHPDGGVTYFGEERLYLTPDLAPAWRLLRGK
jgi:hypothetical protein